MSNYKPTFKAQSAGGVATGKILRNKALEKYYKNPNKCQKCGEIIKVQEGQKIRETKKKKFCNLSCSASHNNNKNPKRKRTYPIECYQISNNNNIKTDNNKKYTLKTNKCINCSKLVQRKNSKCMECYKKYIREIEMATTKKELIQKSKYWIQWRTAVTKNARKIYKNLMKPYKCFICKYDKYVEVCHIRPVSEFSEESTLHEINNKNNLIALCPNHHWEFDNRCLNEEDMLKITEVRIELTI